MRVTVTETIEHSAEITREMIEEYMLSDGWECATSAPAWIMLRRDGKDMMLGRWPFDITRNVHKIAEHQSRKPHEVLYDIARMK